MRLPDIQRGPTQQLGRADIMAPGRTAAAWANTFNKVGQVAKTWIEAETSMELATSKANAKKELSEYTNGLMQKDHIDINEVKKAGVMFDDKDVREITNEDGSISRVIGSHNVMAGMYDAKAKSIQDKTLSGMKWDKGKEQFGNWYMDMDTQFGLSVNNSSFNYQQKALLAKGSEAINVHLAGVDGDNMEETRTEIGQIIDQMNFAGIIDENTALRMFTDSSWTIESTAVNKAIADKDYEKLVELRERAKGATAEDLAARGLTNDHRSKLVSAAEGARLDIMKEWQANTNASIKMKLETGDFVGAEADAASFPGTVEERATKLHQVAVARENGFHMDLVMSGTQGQLQTEMDHLANKEDYGGNKSWEGRKAAWVMLNTKLNQLDSGADSEKKAQQIFNAAGYSDDIRKGEVPFTREELWNIVVDDEDLTMAQANGLIKEQRAYDIAKQKSVEEFAEYMYGYENGGGEYDAKTAKNQDLHAALFRAQGMNETQIAENFADSKLARIPPSQVAILDSVARNSQNFDPATDTAGVLEAYGIYAAATKTGGPTTVEGLSPDALAFFKHLDQTLSSGVNQTIFDLTATEMVRNPDDNSMEVQPASGSGMRGSVDREIAAFIDRRNKRMTMYDNQRELINDKYTDAQADQTNVAFLNDKVAGSTQMAGGNLGQQIMSILGMTPEGTDTLWNGAEAEDRLHADFDHKVEDYFFGGHMDIEQAREQAWKDITSAWGASYSGSKPVLMNNPPEKLFNITETEAKDDLSRFVTARGVNLAAGDEVRLYSMPDTKQSKDYVVLVERANGTVEILRQENTKAPIYYTADMPTIESKRVTAKTVQDNVNNAEGDLEQTRKKMREIQSEQVGRFPNNRAFEELQGLQEEYDTKKATLEEAKDEQRIKIMADEQGIPVEEFKRRYPGVTTNAGKEGVSREERRKEIERSPKAIEKLYPAFEKLGLKDK